MKRSLCQGTGQSGVRLESNATQRSGPTWYAWFKADWTRRRMLMRVHGHSQRELACCLYYNNRNAHTQGRERKPVEQRNAQVDST